MERGEKMSTKRMPLYHIFFTTISLFTAKPIGSPVKQTILNWAEVADNKLSTQIMLDFSGPIQFKTNIDENKHQLDLVFQNMNTETFKSQHIYSKLEHLKSQGIVKSIDIVEGRGKKPELTLSIQFASRDSQNRKNQLIIKSSSVQHDSNNKVIIDIYTQKKLNGIAQKNKILLQASNDAKMVLYKRPTRRIMIDPGHGGNQLGACGFGLEEKNVALDISRRVYKKLKEAGHNVILTRSTDQSLTLLERSQLADQLKADLLVSIHANSAGSLGHQASGIETYYIGDSSLSSNDIRFLAVNTSKKLESTNLKKYFENHHYQSKELASSIQESILSSLNKQNIEVKNRGIKPHVFRLFLHSSIPTALVEVGFISNRHEAALLKKSSYRQTLAHGICQGITNHLKNL